MEKSKFDPTLKFRVIGPGVVMQALVLFIMALALMLSDSCATEVPIEGYKQIIPVPGQNMIVNGNFQSPGRGSLPADWGVEFKSILPNAEVRIDASPEENRNLYVRFASDGDCVVNYLLREKHRYFFINEQTFLYHSLKVKHKGHGVVYSQTIGVNPWRIGGTSKMVKQGDWRTIGGVYPYDPLEHKGITMVRIYIVNAKAGDEYWIDDYVLRTAAGDEIDGLRKELASSRMWPILPRANSDSNMGNAGTSGANLIGDSSFESNPNYCRLRDGTKWWELGGELVRGDAYHGDYAIRDWASSAPYELREGQQYTISFYVKGGSQKRIELKVLDISDDTPVIHTHFTATSKWKRYSVSFIPDRKVVIGEAANRIEISGHGCLIDAVQMQEGKLTAYRAPDLELFLLMQRRKDRSFVTYFFDNEAIPVLATVQKHGPADVTCNVVVRDFRMKTILRIPLHFTIPERANTGRQEVKLPSVPRGAYRVHMETESVKSRSVQFGVISRDLAEGSEICGGSHETGREYNSEFVKALGLTWSRHQAAYSGPYWGRPKDVPWLAPTYWSQSERYIAEKARNAKLRHWGSFFYPPEPYRSEVRKVAGSDKPLPKGFRKNTEEYFEAAIPHFAKIIKYWECWNEPVEFTPKQYLEMLIHFYKTIKRLDPTAIVVGFSGFLDPQTWNKYMVPLIEMGALQHCNIISYHGYFNDWPEDKLFGFQELRSYLDFMRREAAKAGKPGMPIWDDEFTLWGTSWYDDERTLARPRPAGLMPFDYRTGAVAIVHYVTIAYAHGVRHFGPHCFDHDLSQKGEGPIEYDQRAFEYDYGLKPKAISYAVICRKLQNARLVDESIRGDLFTYTFEKPGGSLAVVFMRHGKQSTLKLQQKDCEFRNIFNATFEGVSISGDIVTITMSGEPVYIESTLSGKLLSELLESVVITYSE